MGKVTWNDLKEAKPADLKRVYKLNDSQLEMSIRRHTDGANVKERRDVYEDVYNHKKKR